LSHARIAEAETALNVAASVSRLDALTLEGSSSYGVEAQGSATVTLTNSILRDNSSAAGRVGSGGATLEIGNCTVHANAYGLLVTSGTLEVVNSIVTNSTYYGIERSGGTASVSYSNVWGNGTNYRGTVTTTSTFSANPLYVSATNLRLTSNSP